MTTFDEYMGVLKELSEWLGDYRRVAVEPRALTKVVAGVKKQAERRTGKASDLTKLEIIQTVNTNLTHLFGDLDSHPAIYHPISSYRPEDLLAMYLHTEPERYRKIMDAGYLPLFEKRDLARAKEDFRKAIGHREVIGKFHKALKVIVDKIDDIQGKTELRGEMFDLYIAIRDTGGKPPLAEMFSVHRLNGLFNFNIDEADMYSHRLNRLFVVISKLEPMEVIEVDRNTLLPELEAQMERGITGLEEIYIDLVYAKILSVV